MIVDLFTFLEKYKSTNIIRVLMVVKYNYNI